MSELPETMNQHQVGKALGLSRGQLARLMGDTKMLALPLKGKHKVVWTSLVKATLPQVYDRIKAAWDNGEIKETRGRPPKKKD